MHFMVIHKGDAPPMPRLAAFLARWRREREDAGALGLALDFGPADRAARLTLAPGGERVEHGPFPDTGTAVAGFTVIAAASREAAVAQLHAQLAAEAPGLDAATFEVRETGCPGGCAAIPPASPGEGGRWAILLRSTAATERDEVESADKLEALGAFNVAHTAGGVLLAGDGLKSTARGTRVNLQAGRLSIIDGPFAEAKELIAGFWMVRAGSIDEALDWARRIPYPSGPHVEVEIREVVSASTERGLSPEEVRLDSGLRAEQLDAALRAELAARPRWG